MDFFKKLFRHGEFRLALVLGYYLAWFFALQQVVFDVHIAVRILLYFVLSSIIFWGLLVVVTKLAKQPLFGATKLWFFPVKESLIASIILSILVGVMFAFSGNTEMTTLHIITLTVGFLGSIAAILLYIYGLVKPKEER